MRVLIRIRNWWLSPVSERLDAIERNTRPRYVEIEKPERVLSPSDAERLRRIMRS